MQLDSQTLRRRIGSALQPEDQPSSLLPEVPDRSLPVTEIEALLRIPDDREFVRSAYRIILRRESDISGLSSHLEALRNRTSRSMILRALAESEEARSRNLPSLPPFYELEPSPTGIRGRISAMLRGAARRIGLATPDTMDQRLSFALDQTTSRLAALSSKIDVTLRTLSVKLDASTSDVRTLQEQDRAMVRQELAKVQEAFQSGRLPSAAEARLAAHEAQFSLLRTELERVRSQVESLAKTLDNPASPVGPTLGRLKDVVEHRLFPPVFYDGKEALITLVDGLIVGVPAPEWRLAAHLAFRGIVEPGPIRHLAAILEPGMVVVDVGASVGLYTLHAARCLQGRGKVHSFEPAPRIHQLLRSNVQVNGFLESGIVEFHQAAVRDACGPAKLTIFRGDSGHNTLFGGEEDSEAIMVDTVTLDHALRDEPRVDIVKIDAEGAEPFILRGMRGIIAANPSIRIILEFAPSHLRRAGIPPAEFLDEIEAMGFDFRIIDDVAGALLEPSKTDLTTVFSVNLCMSRRGAGGAA